jgi:5-methylcytosine-specific restriction protein A
MPKRVPTYRPPSFGPPGGDRREQHRRYNQHRRDPEQAKLYGSARWQKFRAYIRQSRVLCERCRAEGRAVVGEHVHHLRDPREHPDGFLSESNVRLLCQACHNRATAEGRGKG